VNSYSTTQKTNIVSALGVVALIASRFGFDAGVQETEIQAFVDAAFAIVGAATAIAGIVSNWVHRAGRGDLTLGGFRK
jgi:hypothetical protein